MSAVNITTSSITNVTTPFRIAQTNSWSTMDDTAILQPKGMLVNISNGDGVILFQSPNSFIAVPTNQKTSYETIQNIAETESLTGSEDMVVGAINSGVYIVIKENGNINIKNSQSNINIDTDGNITINAVNNIAINAENANITATNVTIDSDNINLGGPSGNQILTTAAVIQDSSHSPCTIVSPGSITTKAL